MRNLLNDKKGDIPSILIFIIVIFSIIVSMIVGTKVFNSVKDGLKITPLIQNNSKAMEKIDFIDSNFVPLIANGFVFLFFGMILGILISSFFIDTHPGFFVFFIIGGILCVFLSGIIANVITEFGESAQLSDVWNEYPAVKIIINNLPLIIMGVIILTGIILFARQGSGSNNLGGV